MRQLQRSLSITHHLQPFTQTSSRLINGAFGKAPFHTSHQQFAYSPPQGPKRWPIHNKKIFPPQLPGEERRPAVILDFKHNISSH